MSDALATKPKAKGCPECGSPDDWGGASWCPSCGYYPAIKQQVAVPPAVEEVDEIENWWEIIPAWVWVLGVGVGVLFVVSIAVRVMFAESPIRVIWTVAQMAIGLIALGVVHLMAYFYGVGRTDKLGPLDMFLQPLATWQPVLRDLPSSSNLVCTLGYSVAALVFGFFVVDGVDYVAIMQADAEQRKLAQAEQAAKDAKEGKKKTSAMGYMLKGATSVAQAKQAMNPTPAGPPPDSLEDALSEFTGAAPITGDGTLGSLAEGGSGSLGPSGFGDPITGLTADGGIDVNAYMQQQQAIAESTGNWPDGRNELGEGIPGAPLCPGPDAPMPSSDDSEEGLRRGPGRGISKPKRNVRLSSTSEPPTTPVSTSAPSEGESSSTSDKPSPKELEDRAEEAMEVECLVLGYTTSINGEIRSLLLAAAPDRELLRFVAKVPVEDVDREVLDRMADHFRKIPERRSLVRCPYGGNWVKPEIFCIATYDGWTASHRLNHPKVLRLVDTNQPGKPKPTK